MSNTDDDRCVVCGQPVHRHHYVFAGGKPAVDTRLPPGPKVHLSCIADLPAGWQVVWPKKEAERD